MIGENQIGPWLRTVRHLSPAQVAHRVRLRTLRAVDPLLLSYGRVPANVSGSWPDGFTSIDSQCDWGDADAIAAGRFTFLRQERHLGEPPDWHQADAPRLWRFNLHYMEWALPLAVDARPDDFARLWRSWSAAVGFRHSDGWSPYVASLRAWALCDTFERLVRGTPLEEEVARALWQHRNFVRTHLELDVGGNHLLKNLKALLGLAVFFDDKSAWSTSARQLEQQLRIQVLADGGHFELSPSYHCQVLADLIDIAGLQTAARLEPIVGLDDVIDRMRSWLGAMLGRSDELPMFNDCWQMGPERLALLEPNRRVGRLIVLADSGYVVMNPSPSVHLVMDVGDPCPPSLPAHAHADCLSFELYVEGKRAIVNSGTSTYEPGLRRDFERSTAAHTTVAVDGQNQTEVWATFRAGRLARGRLELVHDEAGVMTVVGSHDGYRYLPGSPVHRRTLALHSSALRVTDVIEGAGAHLVETFFFVDARAESNLTIEGASTCEIVGVASGNGQSLERRLRWSSVSTSTLPITSRWTVSW